MPGSVASYTGAASRIRGRGGEKGRTELSLIQFAPRPTPSQRIAFSLLRIRRPANVALVMAKVLGKSGRYVSQEAVRKRNRILLITFVVMALLGVAVGFVEGFVLSRFITYGRPSALMQCAIFLTMLGAMLAVSKWAHRKIDGLEKERASMMRGAAGEHIVSGKLTNFPDEFRVINDLTTPFGNLDHVVIGPTGVFVLDSKHWRGIVSSDGKGELLLNEQPTDKPVIRQFVGRVMRIREKVRLLATGLDPFYQGVFVFTAARVQAKWGTTGSVHCITDDQLYDYIVTKDFGKKLKPTEVQSIAQAFLGLAHMDSDFGNSNPPRQTGTP